MSFLKGFGNTMISIGVLGIFKTYTTYELPDGIGAYIILGLGIGCFIIGIALDSD